MPATSGDPDPVASGILLPTAAPPTGPDEHVVAPAPRPRTTWADVPWRTIIGTIGLVLAAGLGLWVLRLASRIVVWTVIAGFFAIVLNGPVTALQRRCHLRRGLAIAVVVGATLAASLGLLALFVLPVRTQLVAILTDLPGTVRQAAEGRGPVGRIVTELHLEQLVRDNEGRLTQAAESVSSDLPGLLPTVVETVLAIVTIMVMACLMLSGSKELGRGALAVVPVRHRGWVADVARDAARAISGYMIGNLLISVCATVAAFVVLLVLRVPNAVVLSLWVGFADLIPLVGATLGAVVVVIAALLQSPTAGIVTIVFFVVYQQFENHVLQVVIMARTVRINPLVVLVSVLVGVELFGFVGALLAVPVAGAGNVVVRELWAHRPASPDELIVVTSGDQAPPTRARRAGWLTRLRRLRGAHGRPAA